MARVDDIGRITASLTSKLKTNKTIRWSDDFILTAVVDENNKVDNGGSSRTIKNLAKFKSL